MKWERVAPGLYRSENVEIAKKAPGCWTVWRVDDAEHMLQVGECPSLKVARENVEKCIGSHSSLDHLTATQRKRLLCEASDLVAAGNDRLSWNQARELVRNKPLDHILARFPGNGEDYRKRGIDFDPRTGQQWTDKG